MSKKLRSILFAADVFFAALYTSCGFGDIKGIIQKSEHLTTVLKNNCHCDEISLLHYSISTQETNATFKLVGCEFTDLDSEALRIKKVLSDSIPGFCDFDAFHLIFVNKGVEKVKSYSKCSEL